MTNTNMKQQSQLIEQVYSTLKTKTEDIRATILKEEVDKKAKQLYEEKVKLELPKLAKQLYTRIYEQLSTSSALSESKGSSANDLYEVKQFYDAKMNELTSLTEDLEKSHKQLINEHKVARKEAEMLKSANERMKAKVKAYDIIECSPYKNQLRNTLLECDTVDQVTKKYNELVIGLKEKQKLTMLTGLDEAKKAGLAGKGYSGDVDTRPLDAKTFEMKKLSGLM